MLYQSLFLMMKSLDLQIRLEERLFLFLQIFSCGTFRNSDKEFIQFLYIALGSLSELETQYLIAVRLKYIIENKEIENKINEVKKMIVGLQNYLLKK